MTSIKRKSFFLEGDCQGITFQIPVVEIYGTHSGPTLALIAGVHGDEFEGTRAIHLIDKYLSEHDFRGRVLLLPIANPLAYREQLRETPTNLDGKNLARIFPGDPQGTITDRIADRIWSYLTQMCGPNDLVVDLHSGGRNFAYAKLAGVREMLIDSPQTRKSIAAARAMCLDNLWFMEPTRGTLSTSLIAEGIPAIGCEVEGRGGLSSVDVNLYVKSLKNLLSHLEMIAGLTFEIHAGEFSRTQTIYSTASGYAIDSISLNAQVHKGQVLCKVLDVFGREIDEIRSTVAGEIWAIRTSPSINEGDIVALIRELF